MKKVVVFIGSLAEFKKIIPEDSRNLTDAVMKLDKDSKTLLVKMPNGEEPEDEILKVEHFVIYSNEYSGVREHVVLNFANFLAKMDIDEMYLHNPPIRVLDQVLHIYGDNLQVIRQKYPGVTKNVLKKINKEYSNQIIGQDSVKEEVITALYPLINKKNTKPVVMLFYGPSGIGKTETAQFIARVLKGKLFRRQFSMYQNNEFATYLFGGSLYQGSFARDLLDRESNIILLDEFDKAYSVFHSAFYQLFDEGVYEDQNYTVNVDKAIIICTSNYSSKNEIKEKLGEPIYNRFDAVIGFDPLSDESKSVLIDKYMAEYNGIGLSDELEKQLRKTALDCENARSIKKLIKDTFSLIAVRKMLEE